MKNILNQFGLFLDWWNKFSSRLKSIGYLIAVIFLILFVINNGIKRNHIERLIEKTTGLNVQNDILMKENKQLDNQIDLKDSLLIAKEKQIDSVSNIIAGAKIERNYWKEKYDDISEDLSKIPDDSSYSFLQSVFNYPGKFIYPFNGPQVKGLHRTYLENINKDNQLLALESALFGCEQKNVLFAESKEIFEEKSLLETGRSNNFKSIISNKDKEIELLNKELNQNSKWFAGFGIGPNISVSQDLLSGNRSVTIGIGLQYNVYKW